MKVNLINILILVLGLSIANTGMAQSEWPREISISNGGKVVIYQPQPDDFTGNILKGRSAVSVNKTKKDEPIFGAIFYEANLNTDKDSRMATIESFKITNAKFAGVEDQESVNKLSSLIQTEIMKWNLQISIDNLVATIKRESTSSGAENFNNKAPKVMYRDKPTTLIILDGEPKVQKDKDLDADRVVNTPSLIFQEGKQWNMYSGGTWYKSSSITSGWTPNSNLSEKLKSVNEQIKKQEKEQAGGTEPAEKPVVTDIIISTEPAELLQTNGAADYKNITGTSLLYVANSENDIFKDINSQKTLILLAGRWYQSDNLNGPWEFVPADKLPADFAKIPEGSDKDGVLASVAGTDAAEEAKIDAEIPQTAKVDRKEAKVTVEYDGSPKFKTIDGTSLELAENSNVTVMKEASGNYYALDNGIWFIGNSPNGPWEVANDRPKEVDKIPASSEAYNTKYVYVYQTTPEYVYVGYTPGYMGCYIYGPTVIYGTGFYYRPWYGSIYYPRPVTWGFGFHYNPWTGWSMSFGVNVGFMHIGIGFGGGYGYGGGWFGPPYYRPPYYRPPYYGGGGGYYGRGRPVHYGDNNITINNNRNNIYNNKKGVASNTNIRSNNVNNRAKTGVNAKSKPSSRPNNVFADKSGNVHQKANNGQWKTRDAKSNSWKPATNNVPSNMNRESQMRNRSQTRTSSYNNYQRSSSRPATSRPATSRPAAPRRRN